CPVDNILARVQRAIDLLVGGSASSGHRVGVPDPADIGRTLLGEDGVHVPPGSNILASRAPVYADGPRIGLIMHLVSKTEHDRSAICGQTARPAADVRVRCP